MEEIKEKTADEMFEELGYMIDENENEYFIEYRKQKENCCKFIKFDLIDKAFTSFYYIIPDRQSYLTMQELQAINKKCKELRLDMMNKCKYITIRTKNYEKYFYCRLNKKIINYTY